MLIVNAAVFDGEAFRKGLHVRLENGGIAETGEFLAPGEGEEILDLGGDFLLPGFVDVHIHAFRGHDTMEGEEAVRAEYDAMAAQIDWVAEHAEKFGGDVSRLYVTGGSAGGNLALNISYKINSGTYSASADGTPLPRVRAVSVTFPVASVAEFYCNGDLVFGKMAYRMAYGYTGCAPEENGPLYRSLEPEANIGEDAPATHIMVGAGDALVPPDATYALDEALEKAGTVHQTVVIPYANHIFDTVDGSMLNRAYLDLSLRWFNEH